MRASKNGMDGRNSKRVRAIYQFRRQRSMLHEKLSTGTYTYPISFTIPGNSPPTMRCAFGSVVWRLRAIVHRPGTFKSKLIASREVIMIACPTEDDTDDVENIIVERHWDQQLQYLISISGRSFHVGGTVPLTLTMMPLTKMKVHRISVSLEGASCFLSLYMIRPGSVTFRKYRTGGLLHPNASHFAHGSHIANRTGLIKRRREGRQSHSPSGFR